MKTCNFLLFLSFLFFINIVPAKAVGNEERVYQPFVENNKREFDIILLFIFL